MGTDTGHSLSTHVLPGPMTYIHHLFCCCTVAQKTVPMFACFALITILCNST